LRRMIDLIRESAAPASIMRTAARGALSLPAPEMVEILVALTRHPMLREQAQLTLASWDETSAEAIAADPHTPGPVLEYMSAPRNLRPVLLPILLDNPSVDEDRLAEICATASSASIPVLLNSARVRKSFRALEKLSANRLLDERQTSDVRSLLALRRREQDLAEDPLGEVDVSGYIREHADEIKAAENQPFTLLGSTLEEQAELAPVPSGLTTAKAVAAVNNKVERESTIQKIARLSVGERVQLALKGNKEERFILIRDGVKVVCTAVLESPKVTDSEVEMFASMKNVSDSVLRGIAGKRKFIKSYAVIRILTSNPRCPIEVAIPLLPHLLTPDMRNLASNKNISETVRKMAQKIFRDRLSRNE
jgi:hypothetical protein